MKSPDFVRFLSQATLAKSPKDLIGLARHETQILDEEVWESHLAKITFESTAHRVGDSKERRHDGRCPSVHSRGK